MSMTYGIDLAGNNSLDSYDLNVTLTLRPVNALKLILSGKYLDNHNELQYVTRRQNLSDDRYILGTIDQKNFGMTFRADLHITPEFSVQYYGSPFLSRGKYSDFKYVIDPDNKSYNSRFENYHNSVMINGKYMLDENNDLISDYSINNPDFNFYQFRSNFVAKWEYRLGSFVYFVWSAERTARMNSSDASLLKSYRQQRNVFPNNIFLIKLNYWFSV